MVRPRRARARWLGEGSPGECPLCVEQTGPMSSPAQPEWRNKRAQASGRYGKRPGSFIGQGSFCPLHIMFYLLGFCCAESFNGVIKT